MVVRSSFSRLWRWKYRDHVILIILIVTVAGLNVLWRAIETRPPHWDMGRHLATSLQYLEAAKSGEVGNLLFQYAYYPPLLYYLATPFYLVLGTAMTTAVLVNVVFVAVLTLSVYGIGKLLHGRMAGVLSAVFILGTPMFVTQFKEYQLDAPLAALVALSLWLLLKSDHFAKRGYSILLGLSIGLGCLSKWTFPLIMALPVTFTAVAATKRSLSDSRWEWPTNLLLAGLVAYAIASPWYITNQLQVRNDLAYNGGVQGAREGDPAIGTYASNSWYLWNLIAHQLYLLPSLLAVVAIIGTAGKKLLRQKALYPALLAAGTILVFTLLRNKDPRYTLPALVGLVPIVMGWLVSLRQNWLRWALIFWVAAYSVFSFISISFGPKLEASLVLPSGRNIVILASHGYIIGPPTNEGWHMENLFTHIAGSSSPDKTLAYQGPESVWFNHYALSYYALRYDVSIVPASNQPQFFVVRGNSVKPAGYAQVEESNLPDNTTLILLEKS